MKTVPWILFAAFVSTGALAAGKAPDAGKTKDSAKDQAAARLADFKAHFPKKPHRLSGERYAEPGAPTDYTKPDGKRATR
jgi:hypothetical protein